MKETPVRSEVDKTFPVKDQRVNILGFDGHEVSDVTATRGPGSCSGKVA